MLVARFMSEKEWKKLNCGMKLYSMKQFNNYRTASEGFCFMPIEKIEDINYIYMFLMGIVSDDFVVIFETTDHSNLKESWGVYADPTTSFWDDTITTVEYCTNTYSIDTLKPVNYGVFNEDAHHWDIFPW